MPEYNIYGELYIYSGMFVNSRYKCHKKIIHEEIIEPKGVSTPPLEPIPVYNIIINKLKQLTCKIQRIFCDILEVNISSELEIIINNAKVDIQHNSNIQLKSQQIEKCAMAPTASRGLASNKAMCSPYEKEELPNLLDWVKKPIDQEINKKEKLPPEYNNEPTTIINGIPNRRIQCRWIEAYTPIGCSDIA
jgi:hypothetical protein